MANFKVSIVHEVTREQAVDRLRGFSDRIRVQFQEQVTNVVEEWDDQGNVNFSFTAMGLSISGDVLTDETSVNVSGKLPFAALPFKGMIEQTISEKISEALADD